MSNDSFPYCYELLRAVLLNSERLRLIIYICWHQDSSQYFSPTHFISERSVDAFYNDRPLLWSHLRSRPSHTYHVKTNLHNKGTYELEWLRWKRIFTCYRVPHCVLHVCVTDTDYFPISVRLGVRLCFCTAPFWLNEGRQFCSPP